MIGNLLNSFVSNGVYAYKGIYDCVWVCQPCYEDVIGKLVQYKKSSKTTFEKTELVYFLNSYFEDDVKSLFLKRENYDMIGLVGKNFELSADTDKTYLVRKS